MNTRRHIFAFTLIEVMISIVLVLVLILGVNKVFKAAADTVGTGQALSAKIRDSRAVQSVFTKELAHVAPDGPLFIIDSRTQVAYRNAADEKSDQDGNPLTVDVDGNNKEGEPSVLGEVLDFARASLRNHRVDTLSFFTRDLYPRQTGNPGTYMADQSSNEAWVTYSHLRVYDQKNDPDQDASYPAPGAGNASTNPKNYYADDWVLGRVPMLLVAPIPPNGSPPNTYPNTIYDRSTPPIPQRFWFLAQNVAASPVLVQQLIPLGITTPADNSAAISITDLRYDLIGTSIADFRTILANYIEHTKYFTAQSPQTPKYTEPHYWKKLPTDPSVAGGRFRCNPIPFKPLDSRKLAQAAPPLLNNCTQFIVEFAGDFLTQTDNVANSTSTITALAPDGVIDFYYPKDPASGLRVRRIRWYGFPRDVDGDGHITGYTSNAKVDDLPDVVPVRDVAMTMNGMQNFFTNPPTPNPLAFERQLAKDPGDATDTPQLNVYANYADPNNGIKVNSTTWEHYTAVWGPDTDARNIPRPKMIRIITTVDDPNGHLGDGQTYEFVFNLP